jgi:hypothetical protein
MMDKIYRIYEHVKMAPGGRFELPFPCENALYG